MPNDDGRSDHRRQNCHKPVSRLHRHAGHSAGHRFHAARQETAAIVGASGSGKSTLLSIIAGLDTPTRGTVRLAGADLFALDEDERAALRAQKVGFVFQSFQLLANLSALENVMLPLELLGRKDARKRGHRDAGPRRPGRAPGPLPQVLSGGEQQRVALARAFVVQPAVLLADEPTGSLDFATGERVMELMFDLNREAGTTLVLVTHDRGIAARCERQIHIEAGRVSGLTRAKAGVDAGPPAVTAGRAELVVGLRRLAQVFLELLQLDSGQALHDLRLDFLEAGNCASRVSSSLMMWQPNCVFTGAAVISPFFSLVIALLNSGT